ncbi:MAG: hypothetical protein RIR18_2470 [Pseudomonadota bacterium]|jgi:hypothetical protein
MSQIPDSFYEASRTLHSLNSLTQAILSFADQFADPAHALTIIGGLADAQAGTVAKLTDLINQAEGDLMSIGVSP